MEFPRADIDEHVKGEVRNERYMQKEEPTVKHHAHGNRADEVLAGTPSTALAAMIFWYGLPRTASSARVGSACGRSADQARSTSVASKRVHGDSTSRSLTDKIAVDACGCAQGSSQGHVLFFSSPIDALHALENM
eukprot:TRINITY_DN40521_c0_g1_i1.p1 TRINITY_DN40521_c0_g1~~TRINITY_DN40521_c0_g1_i1.p1  ORF type:complete len:157 (+),score=17.97 TRINITY_DN40521_c0_g1_i1:67-471(+)